MARDLIHENVKNALIKAGWDITHDPLVLRTGNARMEVDLGAEKIIIAQKGKQKIAVEIKSFRVLSVLQAFYEALGKYLSYRSALKESKQKRELFLAISTVTSKRIQKIPFVIERFQEFGVNLIVIDIRNETIVEWK